MGTDECILYSYDMATLPSVIPAFANAKDIILADEVGHVQCRHCQHAQTAGCVPCRSSLRDMSLIYCRRSEHAAYSWQTMTLAMLWQAVNYAIQNGCVLSRAKVHYFKHNDMEDLERLLSRIDASERKKR